MFGYGRSELGRIQRQEPARFEGMRPDQLHMALRLTANKNRTEPFFTPQNTNAQKNNNNNKDTEFKPNTAEDIAKYEKSGFEKNFISDSLYDALVNKSVAQQTEGYLGDLQAKRAYGGLTGIGFDRGMELFNEKAKGTKDELSNIAGGVLAKGRQSLFDILTEAKKAQATAPKKFNFKTYQDKIAEKAKEFNTNSTKYYDEAVAGGDYFNESDLWNAIAAAQGINDFRSNDTMRAAEQDKYDLFRGTGNYRSVYSRPRR